MAPAWGVKKIEGDPLAPEEDKGLKNQQCNQYDRMIWTDEVVM